MMISNNTLKQMLIRYLGGVGGKGRGWRAVYGEDCWDPMTRGRVVEPTSRCAEQRASIYSHYESTFSHRLISDQSVTNQ